MFASLSSFSKLAKSWSVLILFDDLLTEFMSFAIPRPQVERISRESFRKVFDLLWLIFLLLCGFFIFPLLFFIFDLFLLFCIALYCFFVFVSIFHLLIQLYGYNAPQLLQSWIKKDFKERFFLSGISHIRDKGIRWPSRWERWSFEKFPHIFYMFWPNFVSQSFDLNFHHCTKAFLFG